MTDGQAPSAGLREIAADMAHAQVTLSAVGLGGGVDAQLLGELASLGKGRARVVAEPQELPAAITAAIQEQAPACP